jgi:hypothetical protein
MPRTIEIRITIVERVTGHTSILDAVTSTLHKARELDDPIAVTARYVDTDGDS